MVESGNHYLMVAWGRPDLRDIITLDGDIYLFREEHLGGVFALVVNQQSEDKIVDVSDIPNTEHFIEELVCEDEMLDGGLIPCMLDDEFEKLIISAAKNISKFSIDNNI